MAPKRPRGNPNWAKDPETGKGKSGNPGGQHKTAAETRKFLADHSHDAAERLLVLMASQDEKIALQAAKAILEWGLGKPATIDPSGEVVRDQVINVNVPDYK